MIFAECTSCLRVGAGRQMEVVGPPRCIRWPTSHRAAGPSVASARQFFSLSPSPSREPRRAHPAQPSSVAFWLSCSQRTVQEICCRTCEQFEESVPLRRVRRPPRRHARRSSYRPCFAAVARPRDRTLSAAGAAGRSWSQHVAAQECASVLRCFRGGRSTTVHVASASCWFCAARCLSLCALAPATVSAAT